MSMSIIEALLPEYDHEMGTTRRLLERVPAHEFGWSPHPRSMTLGRLVRHLAEIPAWAEAVLERDFFELDDRRPPDPQEGPLNLAEVLDTFDRGVAETRQKLARLGDGSFLAPWSLKRNGHEMFTLPRLSVVRSFLLNHMIHHRGQLSVYLRLKEVPLPPIYGPTADEAIP
jgi:uncharacterized damage-inducible protein DinB